MADHFRLLVDLLGHEVAVIGLVDQRGRGAVLERVAMNDRVVPVVDGRAVARQHDPVAVLEIADRVRERAERDGIRAQIHFAVAMADGERRSIAGADHQIIVAREDEPEREGAAKLRQRRLHRLDRVDAPGQISVDQVQDDFGVGFGLEDRTVLLQLLAQFAKILDDAVVDHGDPGGCMRMGVVLVRLAVRGPARVTDAGVARQRRGPEFGLQVFQLAFGAAAIEMVAFQRGDARGIIAAILKALERIHQLLRDRSAPENADNAAHAGSYLQIERKLPLRRRVLLTKIAAVQILNNYCRLKQR